MTYQEFSPLKTGRCEVMVSKIDTVKNPYGPVPRVWFKGVDTDGQATTIFKVRDDAPDPKLRKCELERVSRLFKAVGHLGPVPPEPDALLEELQKLVGAHLQGMVERSGDRHDLACINRFYPSKVRVSERRFSEVISGDSACTG